jgi:hypothetical protein
VGFQSEGMRRAAIVFASLATVVSGVEGVSVVLDLPPRAAHSLEAWLVVPLAAVVGGVLVFGLFRVVDWLIAGFAADWRRR